MELALIVWLVMTVFPTLGTVGLILFLGAGGYLCMFGFIAGITSSSTVDLPTHEFCKRRLKSKVWIWALIISFFCALVPSKETSWYMVGAYATQTVVQSDTAKELAGDGMDVLKSLMARAKAEIEGKPEVKK